MVIKIAKVTNAPLPYVEASACLSNFVLNNKEYSDSEFFAADIPTVEKIQNLNFFVGFIIRVPSELRVEGLFLLGSSRRKIQILNFRSSLSLLQRKNSESEFSRETEPFSGPKPPTSYPGYWASARPKMRELKM